MIATTPLTVDRATDDGSIIDVQKDGTSVGNIGANGSNLYMSGPQKGIKFGNASADPCKIQEQLLITLMI